MELCVLGSGSSGNSIFIASGGTGILVDAGLRLRTLRSRLREIGRETDELTAVLITHEHSDHCVALPALVKAHPQLRLFANEGTASGVENTTGFADLFQWEIFATGTIFTLGNLQILSFSVPHDAGDPVAFVLDDGDIRVGIATDLGVSTPVVRHHLRDCDVLVLETNHDVELLRRSGRPMALQQRILGRHGHLSNEQAAELLGEIAGARLRVVFTAHISADCNKPELCDYALREALAAIGRRDVAIEPTYRDRISIKLEL